MLRSARCYDLLRSALLVPAALCYAVPGYVGANANVDAMLIIDVMLGFSH